MLIEVELQDWSSMSVPDIYFSIQYYETSKVLEPDYERIVLLQSSDEKGVIFLPLIIRRIPDTKYYDATTAYGYGGPWIEGSPDLSKFPAQFDQWATENGIVCSFLRFHPLIRNAELFIDSLPIRRIGPTAGWNLEVDGDLVQRMAKDHRKTLRRALKAGLESRIDLNPADLGEFKSIYSRSMKRLSAASFYHFEDQYWCEAHKNLGDSMILVEAVIENQVVAAIWCLITDEFLHFHLSGTTDEGRRLGGAVLCRITAAQWAKDQGLRLAHSGGGAGGEESTLLKWKHRFDPSSELLDFHVADIIHQHEIFSSISAQHPGSNFFPPWRSSKLTKKDGSAELEKS